MGRRVYVHQLSLDLLARSDKETAVLVVRVQQATRARKIFHHQVFEVGVELGLARRRTAERLSAELDKLVLEDFTTLLHRVGHRPRRPQDRHGFHPLLHKDEEVVGTCFESGYYTFATDGPSTERMYGDHVRLKELWRAYMDGTAPADLTMVKGRVLALVADVEATGWNTGHLFQGEIDRVDLEDEDLHAVRTGEAEQLYLSLVSAAERCKLDMTTSERKLLADALASIERCLLQPTRSCGSR